MLLRRAGLVVLLVMTASPASATPHPHGSHHAAPSTGHSAPRAGSRSPAHAHGTPVHRARAPHSHGTASHHRRASHSHHRTVRHHAHTPLRAIAAIAASPRPAIGTRSAGCNGAVAVAATGLSEQTLVVRGVPRTFLLFVPASYDPAVALPLVFAFHGRTGTPGSLRSYMRLEREAAGGAVFVYPAGLREVQAGSQRSITHWEVGPEGADIAFFDAILESISNSYCVDRGRVFAAGHSAGASVTNEVGCQRGNVLRAIAPVAGGGPFERRCTPPPSVWLTHGRADAPVPFHHGESSRDHWVAAAHCTSEPVVLASSNCEVYVNCADDARVVFCPHDGDHGPPPFAPHEIWSFFTGLTTH